MPLNELTPSDRIAATRESPLVCIPLYGAHDYFVRCFESAIAHTGADVPFLIADDAGPDPASRAWMEELDAQGRLPHRVHWLRQPENLGFVGNVNAAFDAAPTADVVVLNSDCVVGTAWLDRLRAAAHSDTLVATASTLTNHGSIASLPHRNTPMPSLPQDVPFERAAALLRQRSRQLRPRIPTGIGHCFYVRRTALDLVGGFDPAFSPGYGEEVDFSQRCIAHGLTHVLADDVLVLHYGSASFNRHGLSQIQAEHELILTDRYPFYEASVKEAAETTTGPLPRALAVGRRAMQPLSVTIDARCLHPVMTGTQINTLELMHALWRTQQLRIRVLVPPDLGDYAAPILDEMSGVERVVIQPRQSPDMAPTDLVHRPYQISSEDDLGLLARAGERLIVTHLDLIAYRNPAYHQTVDVWSHHRRLTRHALAASDHVLFGTRHAEEDARAEDLLQPGRHSVVSLGVDHRLSSLEPEPLAPPQLTYLETLPFLLCLGTDFHHKNRVFALRLLDALQHHHGWQGRLVFAGPRVRHGSSSGEEAAWRAKHPDAAAAVVELSAISESEKAWLYDRCAAALYPTVSEGFGFVPFEAAAAGKPCIFARQASLVDVLPDATATIVPWDADATAGVVFELLSDPERQAALVQEVREAGAKLTWDDAASRVIAAYEHTLAASHPTTKQAAVDALETEVRYWHLWNMVGGTGLALVGPDGRLDEPSQRALAALTSRRVTGAPLLAALKLAGFVGGGFRRQRPDRPELTEGSARNGDSPG